MLDSVACAGLSAGAARASVESLAALAELLAGTRQQVSTDAVARLTAREDRDAKQATAVGIEADQSVPSSADSTNRARADRGYLLAVP